MAARQMSPPGGRTDVYRAENDVARPHFPEFDLTPDERRAAVAEILLRGVRRLEAERKREKTRRWRERKGSGAAAAELDVAPESSPPPDEEVA